MIQRINYLEKCLYDSTIGEVEHLSDERKKEYSKWLKDQDLLLHQAVNELRQMRQFEERNKVAGDESLPPIHIYRVPFDLNLASKIAENDFPEDVWRKIQDKLSEIKAKYRKALKERFIDHRRPLDETRRAWFEEEVRNFNLDEYPEEIPRMFSEASCNIFGHMCPVFFTAEIMTETNEERRIGRRQIPFPMMMRIVRRDDYRCQHCKKKLRDDEVEFDHIIPVSKGGSSEEHNLRLTCFDCNRDKSDDYTP